MAYNKRTWLGRQGTGLNKFSIGGASPVTIVNQPDSVTQVGDALSAGNMNDLEDRIEDAFDDVDTALDTKADEQDVTNLNDAIAQHEARIENLEEAHGSYHEVDAKSVYTIPTGKGSNWLIDALRGVSRVENNLVQNPSFETGVLSPWTIVGGNATVNNNKVVVTSASLCALYQSIQIQKGHIYLLAVDIDSNNTNITFGIYKDSSGYKVTTAFTGKKMLVLANIDGDVDGHNIDLRIRVNDSNSTTYTASNFIVKDLTVYFNGTIPTDADTISEIQTNYPWLLTPSDYGTSGVNSVYEGVLSEGCNRWQGTWNLKGLDSATGAEGTGTIYFTSADYIPFNGSPLYFYLRDAVNGTMKFCFYDSSKNYLGSVIGNVSDFRNLTLSNPYPTARFVKFNFDHVYGTTYSNPIQVCYNTSTEKTTHHDYVEPVTLTFPSPISLKSAGAVADTCEPCVEVGGVAKKRTTQRVGTYTFTGNETLTDRISSFGRVDFSGLQSSVMGSTENALMAGFEVTTAGSTVSPSTYNRFAIASDGRVLIQIPSQTTVAGYLSYLTGKTIYFELATPVVTLSAPILDNLIATEAGGTIESILTNPVDDSMTLGYINL